MPAVSGTVIAAMSLSLVALSLTMVSMTLTLSELITKPIDGTNCWDDLPCAQTLTCDASDCVGPRGPSGIRGPQGIQGIPGTCSCNATGSITNDMIAPDANISRSKIGPGAPNFVIVNDASGFLSQERFLNVTRGGTGGDSSVSNGTAHVNMGVWSYSQIVNSDVANLAGIARFKMAAGSINQVLINDGFGFMSSEPQLSPFRGGTGLDTTGSTGIARVASGTWFIGPLTFADISAGVPNSVIVSNQFGLLTNQSHLSTILGGTGVDSSTSTGIPHVNSGSWTFSQITNADINSTAAISRSKIACTLPYQILVNDQFGCISEQPTLNATLGGTGLNTASSTGIPHVLAGTWSVSQIVNADVASTAAINRGKIAATAANQVVINDALGFLTTEPFLSPVRGGTGIDTSTSTGVPQVNAGTWSVPLFVSPQKGGTGVDSSGATGFAFVSAGAWSFMTSESNFTFPECLQNITCVTNELDMIVGVSEPNATLSLYANGTGPGAAIVLITAGVQVAKIGRIANTTQTGLTMLGNASLYAPTVKTTQLGGISGNFTATGMILGSDLNANGFCVVNSDCVSNTTSTAIIHTSQISGISGNSFTVINMTLGSDLDANGFCLVNTGCISNPGSMSISTLNPNSTITLDANGTGPGAAIFLDVGGVGVTKIGTLGTSNLTGLSMLGSSALAAPIIFTTSISPTLNSFTVSGMTLASDLDANGFCIVDAGCISNPGSMAISVTDTNSAITLAANGTGTGAAIFFDVGGAGVTKIGTLGTSNITGLSMLGGSSLAAPIIFTASISPVLNSFTVSGMTLASDLDANGFCVINADCVSNTTSTEIIHTTQISGISGGNFTVFNMTLGSNVEANGFCILNSDCVSNTTSTAIIHTNQISGIAGGNFTVTNMILASNVDARGFCILNSDCVSNTTSTAIIHTNQISGIGSNFTAIGMTLGSNLDANGNCLVNEPCISNPGSMTITTTNPNTTLALSANGTGSLSAITFTVGGVQMAKIGNVGTSNLTGLSLLSGSVLAAPVIFTTSISPVLNSFTVSGMTLASDLDANGFCIVDAGCLSNPASMALSVSNTNATISMTASGTGAGAGITTTVGTTPVTRAGFDPVTSQYALIMQPGTALEAATIIPPTGTSQVSIGPIQMLGNLNLAGFAITNITTIIASEVRTPLLDNPSGNLTIQTTQNFADIIIGANGLSSTFKEVIIMQAHGVEVGRFQDNQFVGPVFFTSYILPLPGKTDLTIDMGAGSTHFSGNIDFGGAAITGGFHVDNSFVIVSSNIIGAIRFVAPIVGALTIDASAVSGLTALLIPDGITSDTFVFNNFAATLTNKVLDDSTTSIVHTGGSGAIKFTAPSKNAVTATITAIAVAANANYTIPNISSDTFAFIGATQTLTNKALDDSTTSIVHTGGTGAVKFTAPATNGVTTTITTTAVGSSATYTIPNIGSDTFVFVGATQTLTSKTLTLPIISSISNGGTVTIPSGTDTFVTLSAVQTLTSKTLTAPTIATITNGGTVTIPTGTDTLVNLNSVQTLTQKTLTAPTIATITNGGTVTIPSGTDTLVNLNSVQTLTQKTLTAPTIATITNGGTVTIPAGTDTLVNLAGTQTLTGKTFTNNIYTGITRITSASTFTNNIVPAALTGLTATLTAAGQYIIEAYIPVSVTATPGIRITLDQGATLTATSISFACEMFNGAAVTASGTSTALATPCINAAAAGTQINLRGTIVVNAAGTLVIKAAQSVSSATSITVNINGYMDVRRLA